MPLPCPLRLNAKTRRSQLCRRDTEVRPPRFRSLDVADSCQRLRTPRLLNIDGWSIYAAAQGALTRLLTRIHYGGQRRFISNCFIRPDGSDGLLTNELDDDCDVWPRAATSTAIAATRDSTVIP
jgi:hypothetical protein